MILIRCLVLVCLLSGTGLAAQTRENPVDAYSRTNTWTMFMEGSPTSSHILLGFSRSRIFATAGGSYSRLLMHSSNTSLSYVAEVRPVEFLADPLVRQTIVESFLTGPYAGQTSIYTSNGTSVSKCKTGSTSGIVGFPGYGMAPFEVAYALTTGCDWRWTFGQTYVPAGFKYSFRTQRRIQPYAVLFAGYMYTSRPVPVESASPFNFVFGTGAGLELYRTQKRSVSVEARFQHFSNKNTAESNPGVDSVMYRLSYSFGH